MSRSTSPSRRLVRPAAGLLSLGLLVLAVAALPGCDVEVADTQAAVPGASATSSDASPAPAGDVLGLTVEFTRKEPALIPVGETGVVEVRIEVRDAIDGVRLEVTGDDGLEILTRQRAFDLGHLAAGDVIARSFEVRPSKEGLLYCKAHIQGRRDGRSLGHSGAIPVLTSEGAHRAALETPGRVIVDPTGRRIIEMPADGSAGDPAPTDDADDRR